MFPEAVAPDEAVAVPEVETAKDQNFFPQRKAAHGETRRSMRLSARGFQLLVENLPHLSIPDLPQEEINDKSKGDAMAKSLVCFQCM